MNIRDVEYGEMILSIFSKDITKYDYRNRSKEDNPLGHEGVSLITWDGRYNAIINYRDKGVIFKIEDDYYKYLNNQIFYENLTKSHYDYFIHYLGLLKEHTKKCSELSSEFRNQLPQMWIRQEKLNQLI